MLGGRVVSTFTAAQGKSRMAQKTILMIHGFYTGSWVWEGYVGLLEQKGFRCIAVDLPCHGTRDDPPPPQLARLSISDYVAYVEN